jgi:hypothetical protein
VSPAPFGRAHSGGSTNRSTGTRGKIQKRKCTEPVAPSSGFPTDLRRSGCRSESHQPRTLRTRCKQHPRRCEECRQGTHRRSCRYLRYFQHATVELRTAVLVRRRLERRKRAGQTGPTRRSSPSRERFRPPSRRTFRFRVVLLGGLRPTGAPCSAQRGHYAIFARSFKGTSARISPYLRAAPRSELG